MALAPAGTFVSSGIIVILGSSPVNHAANLTYSLLPLSSRCRSVKRQVFLDLLRDYWFLAYAVTLSLCKVLFYEVPIKDGNKHLAAVQAFCYEREEMGINACLSL